MGALPNPGMDFTPLDTLPAASLDDIVENIEALKTGAASVDAMSRATTTLANPYKFRARRVAAWNNGGSTPTKVPFDTEDYDTNNNFSGGTYTAPVAGFYRVNAAYGATNSNAYQAIFLYKNGAIYQKGGQNFINNSVIAVTYGDLVQSAASDTWEIYVITGTIAAIDVSTGNQSYFTMSLESNT